MNYKQLIGLGQKECGHGGRRPGREEGADDAGLQRPRKDLDTHVLADCSRESSTLFLFSSF